MGRLAEAGSTLFPETRFFLAKSLAEAGRARAALGLVAGRLKPEANPGEAEIGGTVAVAAALGDRALISQAIAQLRAGGDAEAQAILAEALSTTYSLADLAALWPDLSPEILLRRPLLGVGFAVSPGGTGWCAGWPRTPSSVPSGPPNGPSGSRSSAPNSAPSPPSPSSTGWPGRGNCPRACARPTGRSPPRRATRRILSGTNSRASAVSPSPLADPARPAPALRSGVARRLAGALAGLWTRVGPTHALEGILIFAVLLIVEWVTPGRATLAQVAPTRSGSPSS